MPSGFGCLLISSRFNSRAALNAHRLALSTSSYPGEHLSGINEFPLILKSWEEVVEKAVDAEAKASLQPPSETEEIDSRCPKGYRPTKKDESSRDHRDGDKAKSSHTSPPANSSQPQTQTQTQTSKKDKRHQGSRRGHPATGVNTTEVAKKDKDKDISRSFVQTWVFARNQTHAPE